MASKSVSKISVKNVRINKDEVQSIRFKHNTKKGVFSARTRNHSVIRVRADGDKFVAGNRSGKVFGATPEIAFAKAAKELWAC
jgi:hypothetical protein